MLILSSIARKQLPLLVVVVCLSLGTFCSYAQSVKTVSGQYTYYAPENISLEEAKRIALEQAKIKAISNEFGMMVSQNTSTIVRNKNGKSTSEFLAIGGSDINGEWIETKGKPVYDIKYESNILIVSVYVEGKVRKIVSEGVTFDAKVLNNSTDLRSESADFKNNDKMFVYFKAPVDGYVTMYMLDETTMDVYCLLPYRSSGEGAYKIIHDKPYLFFSEKHPDNHVAVDEYYLTTAYSEEVCHLYVVFSPNEFVKARVNDITSDDIPRQLSYKDFHEWLTKVRLRDKKMRVETKMLTIRK